MTLRQLGIYLGISVLLHLVLLVVFTWLFLLLNLLRPAPLSAPHNQKNVRVTVVRSPRSQPPPPLPPPSPIPPPELPKHKPFLDSAGMTAATLPQPKARFESDRDTLALSTRPDSGPADMPGNPGDQDRFLELVNQKASQESPQPQNPSRAQDQKPAAEEQKPQEEQKASKNKSLDYLPNDPKGLILTREEQQYREKLLAQKKQQLQQQQTSPPIPAATFALDRRSAQLHGSANAAEQSSIASEATEFGAYRTQICRLIGSRWHQYVRVDTGLLSLGTVRVRFYVRSDGILERIQVSEGRQYAALSSISLRSIAESSGQMPPFSEKLRQQIGDGFDFEVSFTIY